MLGGRKCSTTAGHRCGSQQGALWLRTGWGWHPDVETTDCVLKRSIVCFVPQGALLERRLEALGEALEMKEAQLAEVLTAANLDPSTLQV